MDSAFDGNPASSWHASCVSNDVRNYDTEWIGLKLSELAVVACVRIFQTTMTQGDSIRSVHIERSEGDGLLWQQVYTSYDLASAWTTIPLLAQRTALVVGAPAYGRAYSLKGAVQLLFTDLTCTKNCDPSLPRYGCDVNCRADVCSGHGTPATCGAEGAHGPCTCDPGWASLDCSVRCCSGRGELQGVSDT